MLNLDDIGIDSRLLEIKKPMKYDIYIAKPNKQIIGKIINEYDVDLSLKFGSINELSLTIPYKLYGEKTMIKVDTRFDELLLDIDNFSAKENIPTSNPQPQRNIETIEVKELMYIKLVYMGKTEWFLIDSINDEISDKDEMSIKCYSIPYELKRKKLSTPIEMETTTISGVVDKLLQDTGWKIGNIDEELSNVYRTITLDGGDRYSNINEVAQSYGAVLIWDTVNKQLNISLINNISQNKGLIVSSQNLLNSLSRERTTENVITRMYGFGNDDLTFENVNPTGKRYIEDFSFFIYPFKRDVNKNVLLHSSYMSDELAHALLDIEELSKIELPKIKEKQSQIISKNTQLSTVSIELIDTKGQRGITQGLLDIAKATQDIDLITQRKYELKTLDEKIVSLEAREKTLSNDISTLQLEISNIQKRISYTALSPELIDELYPFIIDGEFKDDRYIDETDLFNDTKKEFIKNQKPKQVISVDLSTVLQDPENVMYRDKINLGDIATIKYPDADIDYQEPIVGIDIKLDTFDIEISVSEHDSDLSPMDKLASIIYNTSSSIATFEGKEHRWDAIVNIENEVDKMRNGIIDATKNRIVAGVNESVDIGDRGIIIKNPDYPQNILIMQSGVFALSKDGGETWQTAISPDGVMADTIIGRLLVGNELMISNESGTFKIDGNGLEVDINSIKIMSGTDGSKEDILSSWNTTINRITEMANDNVLNEYEKNQLQKQLDAETKIFNDMTQFYISTIGAEGVPSQEYTNLINAYSDMNNLLTKELQSDGFTILDILNRKVTTEVDGVELDRIINNYYSSKDTFLTKTPLEFTSTAIEQTMKEISLNYVKNGEVVNEINLSEDGVKIDGSKIEISGDTTFKDDLIMDTGVIRSKDGTSFVLDLKNNILRLGKTLTIIGNLFVTPSDILKDIIKTEYFYGQSSSPTVIPTDWSKETPIWKDNMYIWEKKVQTLRDGTVNELPPVNIAGAKGATGASGKDGLPGSPGVGIKSTTITYGVNQSDVTKPTNWAPDMPESNPGDYVWTKTEWIYTNDTKETGYSVSRIGKDGNTGEDGIPGMDGVGIEKTTITYAKNTNGKTAPTTGWGAQVPETNPGDFVWTKTEWLYTNGVTETGYSVGKIGNTGSQGIKGADGKSTHIAYANSEDGTLDFSTSDGIDKKYIGIYVDTSTTDSSDPSKYTWTLVKGSDGANGLPGKPGENGLTPYFHVAYANSADGTLNFDVEDSTNRAYLGQYTDFKKEDSTNPSDYTWTLIKGEDGQSGGNFTWNMLKNGHFDFSNMTRVVVNNPYLAYRDDSKTEEINNTIIKTYSNLVNINQRIERRFSSLEIGVYTYSLRVRFSGTELKEGVWEMGQNVSYDKKIEPINVGEWQTISIIFEVKEKINSLNTLRFYTSHIENGASYEFDWEKLEKGTNLNPTWSPHESEIQGRDGQNGVDGTNFSWNMIKGSSKLEHLSMPSANNDATYVNNADGSITYQTNTTNLPYATIKINGLNPTPIELTEADLNKDIVFSVEVKTDILTRLSTYTGFTLGGYNLFNEVDKAVGKWHRIWFTNKINAMKDLAWHFSNSTPNSTVQIRKPMLHLGTLPAPYAPHITEINGTNGNNFTWNLIKDSKTNVVSSNNSATNPITVETLTENDNPFVRVKRINTTSQPTRMSLFSNFYFDTVDKMYANKRYTFSFEARASHEATATYWSQYRDIVAGDKTTTLSSLSTTITNKNMGLTTAWDTFSITFTMPNDSSEENIIILAPIVTIPEGEIDNFYLDLRNWKLEEGENKNPTWSPHITEIQGIDGKDGYSFQWNLIKNGSLRDYVDTSLWAITGGTDYKTNSEYTRINVTEYKKDRQFFYNIKDILESGKTYTMSADVYIESYSEGVTNPFIALYSSGYYLKDTTKTWFTYGSVKPNVMLLNQWQTIYHTFTADEKFNTVTNYDLILYFRDIVGSIRWKNVQLKETDTLTEWSPHQEDLQGADGAPGKGIKDTKYRYAKTSAPSPEPTESQWSTEKPDYNKGDYAWTQVIWEYTDGTVENSAPMMSYIAEDGVGISDTLVAYALSTTNVQPADNLFSPEVPDSKPGDYVWTRVTLDYTNPDKTDTKFYTVARVGKDGVDAKLISLSASEQVFKNNTPTTITVTGLAQNTAITSWTYSSNSGAFTATLPAGVTRSGNTVTITQSTMTANTLTIKASDGTYSDTVTIAKVKDGSAGMNGFTVILTNESQTFPANSAGTVTSYANGYSDIVVYYGSTALTCTSTDAVAPTVNNTYTVTSIAATSGTVTTKPSLVSSNYRITPSALNTDNAIRTITIVARVNGVNYTFKKVLTYTKSKSGANGADATIASTTPPTDTNKLWRDLNEGIVKQFNETTQAWEPFDATIAKELDDYKNTVGTSIGEANEATLLTVFESAYTKQAIDDLIKATEGTISDVEGNAKSEQERLQGLIDANKKETDDEFGKIGNYFDFLDEGLMIGKKDNPVNVLIDNDSLSFYDKGVEVAWFTNEELHVTDTVIERSLTLGNFEFVPRESGNLSFRKKG